MNSSDYRYQPLPPVAEYGRSSPFTRILYLAPGVGDETPLSAHLEVVDVSNTAPYEALSYMWGTDDPREYLWLGAFPLAIKPNLELALRSLRLPQQPRRLWVDAICINQGDVDERTRQVQYMRFVYKYATRVVVWLGSKSPQVEQAFELARRFAQARVQLEAQTDQRLGVEVVIEVMRTINGNMPSTAMKRLSELLERPYFSRTWCIQEVVAASWTIVKVDEFEISFFDLASTILTVMNWRRGLTLDKPLDFWYSIYENRHPTQPFRVSKVPGSIGDVLHLLEAGRAFQATDPRDKVFAILGICDEGLEPVLAWTQIQSSTGPSVLLRGWRRAATSFTNFMRNNGPDVNFLAPPVLRPNYSADVIDVYTDLTRFLMRKQPCTLDVLDHVQHNEDPETSKYPSWVPKWFEPILCRTMKGCFLTGLCDGHFRYFAILHDSPWLGQSLRPKVLSLDGFRVDVVSAVSDVMEFGFADDERTTRVIQAVWTQLFPSLTMLAPNVPRYRNGEPLEDALCHALAASPLGSMVSKIYAYRAVPENLERGPGPHMQLARQEVACFLAHLATQQPQTAQPSTPGQLIRASHPSSSLNTNPYIGFAHFMGGVRVCSLNRRAFLTRDGRIGIGPKIMQPGDEVVGMFGGRLPVVIRPRVDHQVFIGACCVRDDELMWGTWTEKIKFNKPGAAPVCTFELR